MGRELLNILRVLHANFCLEYFLVNLIFFFSKHHLKVHLYITVSASLTYLPLSDPHQTPQGSVSPHTFLYFLILELPVKFYKKRKENENLREPHQGFKML